MLALLCFALASVIGLGLWVWVSLTIDPASKGDKDNG